MLLAEPPRTRFDVHFKVAGFPVRVQPFFWLAALLLGMSGQRSADSNPSDVLIWVFAMFVSILWHELGHAVLIRRYGWSSRIILYHLGGLATIESPLSYTADYNENEGKTKAHILIALAGPGAGFLLAAVLIGILYASNIGFRLMWDSHIGIGWDLSGIPNRRLVLLLHHLLFINIFWGLMNLLPVYPLDGGQVARELFTMKNPRAGIENSLMLSTVVGGIVAAVSLIHFGRDGEWRSGIFICLLFGILAFQSYQILQHYRRSLGGYGDYGGGGDYRDDDDWWKR